MSNNKQSSVEYFLKRLIELRVDKNVLYENVHEAYQQAKEIHRTEIIESYASGSNDRLNNTINTNYYNETFGGNK